MTERLVCKCGGTLRKEGNQYICEYCDSVYLIGADDKGELFAYQPVEKKQIQTGQIAPKAETIAVKEVVVRQIRLDEDIDTQVARESMELDTRSRIGLIEGYLSTGDWEKVDEHCNALLLENKDCAQARWYSWMSEKKVSDDTQMLSKLTGFSQADGQRLDRILEWAAPAFAKQLVDLFMDGAFANDNMCVNALSAILPYARNEAIYSQKEFDKKIAAAFDKVIENTYEKAFRYLLESTLRPEDVDIFIDYMTRFAANCDAQTAIPYFEQVLGVDPGNLAVYRSLIRAELECDAPCGKTIGDVERLIAYSEDADKEMAAFMDILCAQPQTTVNKSDIMWNLLSYHSAAPEGVKDKLLTYGNVLLESRLWLRARDYFNLVLSFDVRCGEAYWGLCLMQMQARNAQDATNKKEPIKSFSAYDKALAVFSANGNKEQVAFLRELSEKQKGKKETKKKALVFGGVILAVALLIFLIGRINQARRYSVNNIKLSLVNVEMVTDPVSEFEIQIKNGCTEYLDKLDMTLHFYDSKGKLIVSSGLSTFCNMPHNEVRNWTVTLHQEAVDALYPYSFDELKITAAVNKLYFFGSYHEEDAGEGKEVVLKKAEKAAASKKDKTREKLDDAFAAFDTVKVTDGDFETQTMEFATALDEIWEEIIRDQDLMARMYEKAEEYQKDAEYEKAYFVFTLLANVEYEDSQDRAYECAVSASY